MRKYRYKIVFIITIFIGILLFLYCRNTINLMQYVTYYYEKTEDGYTPIVSLDYLSLSADIGNISNNEMAEKVEQTKAGDFLESLSTLFLSDYSSLINSIEVSSSKDIVKEGDFFIVNIKWDKDLIQKTSLNFACYNNIVIVRNPEKNTLLSGIGSILGIEAFDENKNYYSIRPLVNEDENIKMFKRYNIVKSTEDSFVLQNKEGNKQIVINKDAFNKYMFSNANEFINSLYFLDKNDFKYMLLLTGISLFLSLLCLSVNWTFMKEKTIFKSYYLSYCWLGIIIVYRWFNIQYNIFTIPNKTDMTFLPFLLFLFLMIGIIVEFISCININPIKGIFIFILMILMNTFAMATIAGICCIFIVNLVEIIIKYCYSKSNKKLETSYI